MLHYTFAATHTRQSNFVTTNHFKRTSVMTLPRAPPEALWMKYFLGENEKLVRMIVCL